MGGLLGMVPGVSQWGSVTQKLQGSGKKDTPTAAPPVSIPASVPSFTPKTPSKGVNGTTNPKGVGAWGG